MGGWGQKGGGWKGGGGGWQDNLLDPFKVGFDRDRWEAFKRLAQRVPKCVFELLEKRDSDLIYTSTPVPVQAKIYAYLEQEILPVFRNGSSLRNESETVQLEWLQKLATWFKDNGWTKGDACIHVESGGGGSSQHMQMMEKMMERQDQTLAKQMEFQNSMMTNMMNLAMGQRSSPPSPFTSGQSTPQGVSSSASPAPNMSAWGLGGSGASPSTPTNQEFEAQMQAKLHAETEAKTKLQAESAAMKLHAESELLAQKQAVELKEQQFKSEQDLQNRTMQLRFQEQEMSLQAKMKLQESELMAKIQQQELQQHQLTLKEKEAMVARQTALESRMAEMAQEYSASKTARGDATHFGCLQSPCPYVHLPGKCPALVKAISDAESEMANQRASVERAELLVSERNALVEKQHSELQHAALAELRVHEQQQSLEAQSRKLQEQEAEISAAKNQQRFVLEQQQKLQAQAAELEAAKQRQAHLEASLNAAATTTSDRGSPPRKKASTNTLESMLLSPVDETIAKTTFKASAMPAFPTFPDLGASSSSGISTTTATSAIPTAASPVPSPVVSPAGSRPGSAPASGHTTPRAAPTTATSTSFHSIGDLQLDENRDFRLGSVTEEIVFEPVAEKGAAKNLLDYTAMVWNKVKFTGATKAVINNIAGGMEILNPKLTTYIGTNVDDDLDLTFQFDLAKMNTLEMDWSGLPHVIIQVVRFLITTKAPVRMSALFLGSYKLKASNKVENTIVMSILVYLATKNKPFSIEAYPNLAKGDK